MGMFIKRGNMFRNTIKRNMRYNSYRNGSEYNVRFQSRFRHAFVTEPLEEDLNRTKTVEESKEYDSYFGSFLRSISKNYIPYYNLFSKRYKRSTSVFDFYVLPMCIATSFAFFPVHWVFKLSFLLPSAALYTRVRDRTEDPIIEETFVREMLHTNEKLKDLFNVNTTQILDYECDFDETYLDEEDFPEFHNKFFQLFAKDGSTTHGYYVFGDVESNSVVKLSFKTMPVRGDNRFMVGEPYFFYEVKAELNSNGVSSTFDIVNKEETLKNYRPFLIY